ncbi:DUF397 domain-containing protein [Streptomyces griseoloalbus]|uniref:DUF397 domain-containing protein n=1 Tax=Streptomyces griseoloalbus TaxID=67303 RepID=UPI0027E48EF6|nr:DUF397 domain-containing protein [Streptomyces albaduncus]
MRRWGARAGRCAFGGCGSYGFSLRWGSRHVRNSEQRSQVRTDRRIEPLARQWPAQPRIRLRRLRRGGELPRPLHVRDSKDKTGPPLALSPTTWADFLTSLSK